ncbi:facilitated trehalose transporter Tret1-like [Tribolium castaneum]|uniref:facilitated trehalose transporter Tret1-like n=1 Tax=Tribolium castaneum TaxID=7070 RepID=UPI0000D56644|nr:PREDICTED: facilitated trehalose transporter Tret1-like [Tribolium castaneum]|eukprot:XP_015836566.1 PREDICTED: facilitated trehalose transporter Tret1-like [Tribolium castaneum]
MTLASQEEGKKWPQFLAVFAATFVYLGTGVHTGWPAPSLPQLLSEAYPHKVTNDEASYITIIGHLGNICGGFLGNLLLDKIGRKKTILLISLPQILSFLLIIASYEVMELLYLGRFIGGVAEGATFSFMPVYIAEVAQPEIRGSLGTLMSVMRVSGMLLVNLIGSYLTIKQSAMIFLLFPIIFVTVFYKMPESPYYLLMKNRKLEAESVLKFLRRKKSVSEELVKLTNDVNRQMSESGTFRDIFRIESNRKALFLVGLLRIFQQCTGFSAFSSYVQILLSEATQTLAPHIGASILLLVQLFMAVLSSFFVDKWGRKPLLIFSTIGCFINLTLQTIFFAMKEYTNFEVSVIDWFPLVMMIIFMILYFSGLGVTVNIVTSEMFSASVKGKTISLVNATFAFGMLATTKFYQTTADNFGLTVPFSIFALLTLFAVIFEYICLPETKGKTLEEIQQELKGNKR